MIPLEFHFNDNAAPQLSNEAGSLLEVFKACLITGYGNRKPAGWKLQYDGWTSKGEQKLAFSVGKETEQELIYWLNDSSAPNAKLSLWSNLNEAKDNPENQITDLFYYAGHNQVSSTAPLEWHLYATPSFCLFLWEVKKNNQTYHNHEGTFLAFGAVKDLFGQFLPQIIIGKTSMGRIPREQRLISCGGSFLLPNNPFSDNEFFESQNELFFQHSGIEYYLPCLCAYSETNAQFSFQQRLFIPPIVITAAHYLTDNENRDWFKVVEKKGAKIIRFNGYYNRFLGFNVGEWDNPQWLNALMSE